MDRYVNLGSSVSQLLLLVVVARVCQLSRRVRQGPLALPRYRSAMRDIDCTSAGTTALPGTPGSSGIMTRCSGCEADDLRRYDHRPNPLMPAELRTVHIDV